MGEREIARRLRIINRLEELAAKHGPPPPDQPDDVPDLDPSWGPVGSLLERLDPDEYLRLLRLDQDAIALERSRRTERAEAAPEPSETAEEPSEPPRPPEPPRKRQARWADW